MPIVLFIATVVLVCNIYTRGGYLVKKVKRLLACIVSLAIVLNVLVLPAATVNAYTKDIASLTVEDYYKSWASASTVSSYGSVGVSLSINTIRTSDGYTSGNATGSSGYISVSVGLNAGSGFVITSASSIHTDPDIRMIGNWNEYSGYSIYYN